MSHALGTALPASKRGNVPIANRAGPAKVWDLKMAQNGEGLASLINMPSDAPAVQAFLSGLDEQPVLRPDQPMRKLRYLFPRAGVVIVESTELRTIIAIYLHGPGAICEAGYPGELPFGLQFSFSRVEVRRRMESQARSGFVGNISFDAWRDGSTTLRVAYTRDSKIAFIALLSRAGGNLMNPASPQTETEK
jgi:hypothetical protein